ncbi:hypothetical protein GCM10010166_21520 [Couchioplanes caeruleus subsp. azureus]|nr:hypothetical protein GCM10010166_21520 [Couchioplanes caeruleus subsp. azureus]
MTHLRRKELRFGLQRNSLYPWPLPGTNPGHRPHAIGGGHMRHWRNDLFDTIRNRLTRTRADSPASASHARSQDAHRPSCDTAARALRAEDARLLRLPTDDRPGTTLIDYYPRR